MGNVKSAMKHCVTGVAVGSKGYKILFGTLAVLSIILALLTVIFGVHYCRHVRRRNRRARHRLRELEARPQSGFAPLAASEAAACNEVRL